MNTSMYRCAGVLATVATLAWGCGDRDERASRPSSGAAAATPGTAPGVDYQTALHQGRSHAKSRAFDQAAASFRAALAARPGDGRALAELSWATFQIGELDEAERAAREALATNASNDVRATALYHLGRVKEARGQVMGAIRSYRESLRLRPDKAVRERLARIDVVRARAADGPHASIEAFCTAYVQSGQVRGDTCGPALPVGVEVESPLVAIATVVLPADEAGRNRGLALRMASGWFVLPGFATHELPHREFSVDKVYTRHGRVLVEHVERTHERDEGDHGPSAFVERWHASYLTICGLGESDALSCLGPIPTAITAHDDAAQTRDLGPSFHVTLPTRGTVTIQVAQTNGADQDTIGAWIGEHALRFP